METKTQVASLGRITVIDALRGFALLGVLIVHMMQHFGIFSFGNFGVERTPVFSFLDDSVQWLMRNVFMGKFINIFAFLFGMSFFIQIDRARRRGVDFRRRFVWRMVILLFIGLVGTAYFGHEILTIYAVFGVILVFLSPLRQWVLIALAAILILGAPRAVLSEYDRITYVAPETEQPEQRPMPDFNRQMPEPSIANTVKSNYNSAFTSKLEYQFGINSRGYVTMALFILGFVVGRSRFFEYVHIRKRRNYVLFGIFAVAAYAITKITGLIAPDGITMFWLQPRDLTPTMLIYSSLNDLASVLYSGAIAMGFICLFFVPGVGRVLDFLSPYGRLGLTNYEMQGLIGCLLFSPWALGGIFGIWSATELFLLALLIYLVQVCVSKLWLTYFIYGPFEWFWRTATYLKPQPFLKSKSRLTAA